MAARRGATPAFAQRRPIRDCLGLGLCVLSVLIAGCASGNSSVSGPMASATPSFMLSDQQKAERQLKDPAALHMAYGRFEEQVGQPIEARKSYEKALAENPHLVEAVLGIARLDQLADKPKEAETGFQRALAMKPGDAAVMAACGQFYASQRRWPEALRLFNSAIAAAPNSAIYKHQLAVAECRAGDLNAALAVFTQLVGPEKAHYNVAYLLAQEGKSDVAAAECRAALSLNPRFEPARSMLDQLQNHQLAGDPRGSNHPMPGAQAAGFAPVAAGNSSPPGPPATQASWQNGSSGSNGFGPASHAVGSFDPALPKSGAPDASPPSEYSNNPWATVPAPPK